MSNQCGPNDGDCEGTCRVFGYYASYSKGPVRTLECGFLGATSALSDAELIMRKEQYRFEFYVIEYDEGRHRVTRYYDEHKAPKFHTQCLRERRGRSRDSGRRRRTTDNSQAKPSASAAQPADSTMGAAATATHI